MNIIKCRQITPIRWAAYIGVIVHGWLLFLVYYVFILLGNVCLSLFCLVWIGLRLVSSLYHKVAWVVVWHTVLRTVLLVWLGIVLLWVFWFSLQCLIDSVRDLEHFLMYLFDIVSPVLAEIRLALLINRHIPLRVCLFIHISLQVSLRTWLHDRDVNPLTYMLETLLFHAHLLTLLHKPLFPRTLVFPKTLFFNDFLLVNKFNHFLCFFIFTTNLLFLNFIFLIKLDFLEIICLGWYNIAL